ncbi:MAG TPA: DUF99 family protein [Nitrococcus sp.]|nr:DUF99 family protein [Nitrococcus sp.]
MSSHLSHVVGFDDAPFAHEHRGDVAVVGAVFTGSRLDGVLYGRVRRDGANATRELLRMVRESRFAPHLQGILLQGVALAGFNVIDVAGLSESLRLPVLVVARRISDRQAIREALLKQVPGGRRKWQLIERLGPMEPLARVHVQRMGLTPAQAEAVLDRFCLHSRIPEPLRTAHLIAGGLAGGKSRQRV